MSANQIQIGDKIEIKQAIDYAIDDGKDYEKLKSRIGQQATVIEDMTGEGHWLVRFDDGMEACALDEEISEMKSNGAENVNDKIEFKPYEGDLSRAYMGCGVVEGYTANLGDVFAVAVLRTEISSGGPINGWSLEIADNHAVSWDGTITYPNRVQAQSVATELAQMLLDYMRLVPDFSDEYCSTTEYHNTVTRIGTQFGLIG